MTSFVQSPTIALILFLTTAVSIVAPIAFVPAAASPPAIMYTPESASAITPMLSPAVICVKLLSVPFSSFARTSLLFTITGITPVSVLWDDAPAHNVTRSTISSAVACTTALPELAVIVDGAATVESTLRPSTLIATTAPTALPVDALKDALIWNSFETAFARIFTSFDALIVTDPMFVIVLESDTRTLITPATELAAPPTAALALASILTSFSVVSEERSTEPFWLVICDPFPKAVFALLLFTVTLTVPPAATFPPETAALAANNTTSLITSEVTATSPLARISTLFPILETALWFIAAALMFPPTTSLLALVDAAAATAITRVSDLEDALCVYPASKYSLFLEYPPVI